MSARYQVIESKVWKQDNTGRTVSVYSACPWTNERDRATWRLVSVGWTVHDTVRNTIGIGCKPWKTREEAQATADRLNHAG